MSLLRAGENRKRRQNYLTYFPVSFIMKGKAVTLSQEYSDMKNRVS